ncbi:NAD(P)H-hydrate dehydratase [Candidatus Peregrinibacteria bacterium]|nr:NAD(P)H-hydrate dehydratase [Candidatus Peregrinibacteria bacterium]
MPSVIKKSDVVKNFPRRDPDSHKGQNGRVLVIGGSIHYFGAPILAGLGAFGCGADLVYLLVPECNFEVSRSYYPDFIVRKYAGNFINSRTMDVLPELLQKDAPRQAGRSNAVAESRLGLKIDCILIGPGVSEELESLRVITRIIEKAECPVVLDAEAIPAIAQFGLPVPDADGKLPQPRFTITPNRAEMDEITEGALPEDPEEELRVVEDFAKKWNVNILLKKPRALIVSPDLPTRLNETGNAGMTVGGSGDVLAGVVASLIAQKLRPYEACQCAAYFLGAAGDNLYRQKGYAFTATDLALELPYTIHSIVD